MTSLRSKSLGFFHLHLLILCWALSFASTRSFGYETYYRNSDFKMTEEAPDLYSRSIQKILDQRCVGCHSCREAQCGLKLTSAEGLQRGATGQNLLGSAFSTGIQSKLFHDGKNENDWRLKGFFSVLKSQPDSPNMSRRPMPSYSILAASLINKSNPNHHPLSTNLLDSKVRMCEAGKKDLNSVPAMPYNMTPVSEEENQILLSWATSDHVNENLNEAIDNPERKVSQNPEAILMWENFFNHPTNKARWTSRYLYEKLFLARFYIKESPGEFYELVRSRTPSGQEIDIIPTLKAFDKPADVFFYRLFKVRSTIMHKDHFVYEVDSRELQNLKDLFWNAPWPKNDSEMSFNFNETNPLIAFRYIPAKSRYTWMLENAKLLLDISARAQNCRSIGAGAPYWDNMLHVFLKPEADVSVMTEDFSEQAGQFLRIPHTNNGRNSFFESFLTDQMEYSKIKQRLMKSLRPNGFSLSDVWDGENGNNKNAVVTVLRHEWTATAYQGQLGGSPRSILLLDYALFERYFYLCNVATHITEKLLDQGVVVNYLFDIKKEGEDQFLSFIDEKYRQSIRQDLVQGFNPMTEFGPRFSLPTNPLSDKIHLQPENPYPSFIKNFLIKKFKPEVIGSKSMIITSPHTQNDKVFSQILKYLTTEGDQSFAANMPNISYLLVSNAGKWSYYTLIANRYYASRNRLGVLSNELYDKSTRIPSRDTLEVYSGIEANFSEKIFALQINKLDSFFNDMKNVKSHSDYLKFNSSYGLSQNNQHFWSFVDSINSYFIRQNPIEGGILDLHKYGSTELNPPQ